MVVTGDLPPLSDNPTLEEWLAYYSRKKYLDTFHFADIADVARWVHEYYRDAERGSERRRELVGGDSPPT